MAVAEGSTRKLHDDAVVVDCHNDLILMLARKRALGIAGHFADYWLPELRAGGVDVQVVPIYIDDEYRPEGALRRTLQLIELAHRTVDAHPEEVALCLTGSQIDAAVTSGRIAFVLALEGMEAIGTNVEFVETFYRLGVRMMAYTHFGRTAMADGTAEDEAGSRLTRAGAEALGEMERLGIVCDVSHLGIRGVEHVLELSTRPVIASHSSARALADHHRNLYDDAIKAIASTGGVIGINVFPWFIDLTAPTLDRVVDHIAYVRDLVGIDHVGIGPDFIREYWQEFYGNYESFELEGLELNSAIEGLGYSRDLPNLTAAMIDRGFSDTDVRKVLGANFLRVFREVMGIPGRT
jgi:membrane dipeptidase